MLASFIVPSHAPSDCWRSAAEAAGTTVSTREVSEKSVLVVREWPGNLAVVMIDWCGGALCRIVHLVFLYARRVGDLIWLEAELLMRSQLPAPGQKRKKGKLDGGVAQRAGSSGRRADSSSVCKQREDVEPG